MSLILDAAGRPWGDAVKASQYDGIVRYLTAGGWSMPDKQLMPDEATSYIANGQTLVSNWETYANRMNEGYDAGTDDVRAAWNWHKQCGGPDNAVVYFSADWDATPDQQFNINEYLRACVEYLGVQSVGVYGGFHVVERVYEWNPAVYLWQTVAWSGGQVSEHAHLFQRLEQVYVGGIQCDVNEVLKDDYGQWNLHLGGNEVATIKSLVDDSDMTPEQATAFIDYHSWRADRILTALANKDGIDVTDAALKAAETKVASTTT